MTARIGRRDYDREPLPPSPARAYLRHLAKWMLIALAIVMSAGLLLAVGAAA